MNVMVRLMYKQIGTFLVDAQHNKVYFDIRDKYSTIIRNTMRKLDQVMN